MKLYGSLTSPFVRVVRIAAFELGIEKQIELVETVVKPAMPNLEYGKIINPLRRVPALETETGSVFIDSRVILEFLHAHANGKLLPRDETGRIDCLNRHAVASGGTEALVLAMYEKNIRPSETHWPENFADQLDKAQAALDWAEHYSEDLSGLFDISALAFTAMIDYANFRFGDIDWLGNRPKLAKLSEQWRDRQSVQSTKPPKI